MPLLRNYLPQNTSDVKKLAAGKHYTNVSFKHIHHTINCIYLSLDIQDQQAPSVYIITKYWKGEQEG
jgi:hypothetical protein